MAYFSRASSTSTELILDETSSDWFRPLQTLRISPFCWCVDTFYLTSRIFPLHDASLSIVSVHGVHLFVRVCLTHAHELISPLLSSPLFSLPRLPTTRVVFFHCKHTCWWLSISRSDGSFWVPCLIINYCRRAFDGSTIGGRRTRNERQDQHRRRDRYGSFASTVDVYWFGKRSRGESRKAKGRRISDGLGCLGTFWYHFGL